MTMTDLLEPDARLAVAHVIRDGGGTASVELTVAAKLRERGHRVTLYGPPEVRAAAAAMGFGLSVLDWAPSTVRRPEDLMPRMIAAAEQWARDLAPRLRDGADVLVADCTAFGAVMAARLAGTPSAAMMPTVYVAGPSSGARGARSGGDAALRAAWAPALAGINRARTGLGLDPVAAVTDQILDADSVLVLTSRAFELPEVQVPPHVRYVGPQLPRHQGRSDAVPEGSDPLVVVSLSTSDQAQLPVLRRLVEALDGLPVRALVTTGPTLDPDDLPGARNVRVERFVPHDVVLPQADLVVTHAGHGTVMAAAAAGVPLVCLPMGRDQPAVAERVARRGFGIALEPDASADAMRAAIRRVLGDPGYRRAARELAARLEPADLVILEIEALAGVREPGGRGAR